MGYIIDTDIKGLNLERKKESYYIQDDSQEDDLTHIFNFGANGLVEMSNEILDKLIKYFEDNPEERSKLKENKK